MHRCRQNEAFTVEDASKDERFQNLDIVKSKTIMFYAAVPISLEGFTIGVLCLVDSNPRKFTEREKVTLNDFAFTAVQCLARLRRGTGCTQQKQQNIAHITHDLMTPLTGLQLSLSLLESDNNLQGNLKVRETLKDVYCCCDILKEIYHESLESLGSLQHALPATKHVTKTDELVHSISKVSPTVKFFNRLILMYSS
jgi:signal transduction histidine kinase